MAHWITDPKTGILCYQVSKRVKLTWYEFNMEILQYLLQSKQITNLEFLEALLDL
jgi:hypothetical protein